MYVEGLPSAELQQAETEIHTNTQVLERQGNSRK